MKQVLLNLLLQTINNQFRGHINLKIFLIEREGDKFVQIDIENSKFEVKPKDIGRMK
jgi:hypothetical protein